MMMRIIIKNNQDIRHPPPCSGKRPGLSIALNALFFETDFSSLRNHWYPVFQAETDRN